MLWIRSNGQGVAYFPTFAGAQHAVQRKEHGGEKILPPSTDCVGFGFFLPSSSPSPVREKQQVEVHSLALLSPSDPMAWLSSALCSLGNPVGVPPRTAGTCCPGPLAWGKARLVGICLPWGWEPASRAPKVLSPDLFHPRWLRVTLPAQSLQSKILWEQLVAPFSPHHPLHSPFHRPPAPFHVVLPSLERSRSLGLMSLTLLDLTL